MPDDGRRLKETRQIKYPEWTRLQWVAPDGHELKTQYRGPGGEIISKHAFVQRVKAGEIRAVTPASVSAATGAPHAATVAASFGADLPSAPEAAPPYPLDAAPVMELPDATPRGGRAAPGQASAAELALSASIGLIILTSLVALVLRTPELQMTEAEAQAIAVPVANLVVPTDLNHRFGRYLAGSSDYTLLGYALYAYGFRVINSVKQRQAYELASQQQRGFPYAVPKSAQPTGASGPAQPQPTATVGGGTGGEPARAPAAGGILGAVSGLNPAESSRIVGLNPLPNPRAS